MKNIHESKGRTVVVADNELLSQVKQLISEGHTVTIRVKGHSMRPLLENYRDTATICPFNTLQKGDIVLAEIFPTKFVLHRIIKIKNKQLTLMGDGNIKGVEQCTTDDVIGLVTSVSRKGKVWKANDFRWRLLKNIWPRLNPIRRYLLAIYKLG